MRIHYICRYLQGNVGKLAICTILLSIYPVGPALAGWMEDMSVKGFNAILNSISTGIASWMFKFLEMFILNPTDLNKLGSNIRFYLGYTQAFGISLVMYFTVQNLFINFIKTGLGEKTPDPARIIGKGAINGVMVVSVHFLLDQLIKINNYLVSDFIDIGVKVDLFKDLFTAPLALMKVQSDYALLFLIMVICSLILAIIGGIRYAEIAFLYIIAPVIMAGDTATNLMGHFFKTAIGIIFTQAVQVVGIGLLMSTIANYNGPDRFFVVIGFLVLLMRGSKTLREFLYSSGTGEAMGGAASQAANIAANRMGALKSLGSQAAASIPGVGSSMPAPTVSKRSGTFTIK